MKSKRKSRRYVVGFDNDANVVYGYPGSGTGEDFVSYLRPMTLFTAKMELKKMSESVRCRACIYELIPVVMR